MKKRTLDDFISKSIEVHGEKYGYSLVFYNHNHSKVPIICPTHGIFTQTPANHLVGKGCPICAKDKRKQTCIKKYGVENAAKNEDIKDKTRQTNLVKYGAKCSLQNKNVKDKRKQTMTEKYGAEYSLQSKDIRRRIIKTNLEKYGVEYSFRSEEVQDRTRQTNLERYGVEYPLQSRNIREKGMRTNLERFGVEYPLQKQYLRDVLEKLNSFEYLYKEYIDNNKTTTQMAEELNVDPTTICNYLRRHNIPVFKIYASSKSCIQWLNTIMDRDNIYIQHAGNSGEYNIPNTRLLVDGYCKDNNTVYEFYGNCFHGNLDVYGEKDYPHPFDPEITTIELYNRTMEREERIRELGYNIVSIWENEWNNLRGYRYGTKENSFFK